MNAVTAILLSILVHLGGVELDTTRDASLQWYRESQLAGQWELEATQTGVYRFASDEGLVIVERLREANMAYALQQLETIESTADEITSPIPRRVRSLGTVSLQPQAQNLRPPRPSSGRLSIDVDRLPVAWTRITGEGHSEDTAPDHSGGENVDSATADPDSPPTGTVVVSITSGQWSVSNSDSGQVMVLRVR